MKKILNLIAAPLGLLILIAIPTLIGVSGCHQTPAQISFKAEGVTIPTVNAAMYGWSEYVNGTNGVTAKQVHQVKEAYVNYYTSQIIASNAFVNFFSASQNADTNAAAIARANWEAAIQTAASSQASLISLVGSLTQRK